MVRPCRISRSKCGMNLRPISPREWSRNAMATFPVLGTSARGKRMMKSATGKPFRQLCQVLRLQLCKLDDAASIVSFAVKDGEISVHERQAENGEPRIAPLRNCSLSRADLLGVDLP